MPAYTDPISGNASWSYDYTYDRRDNLSQRKDPRNVTTTYVYDTFNRVQSVSYSDGTPTVTHYYDGQGLVSTPVNALGKRTAVVNSVSTSRWPEFDAMGRSVKSSQVTGGITCTLTYTYNLAGSLKSVTYPSGKTVTSSFDRLNRVTGLQRAGYSYAQAIKYEPHGAVRSTQLGNGLWEQSRYNDRQQLKQRGVGTSDTSAVEVLNASHCGTLLLDFDYGTTNNNGNLRTGKITIGSHVFQQSYTYDGINRLKTASESKAGVATWSQTYQYDQWGNRWVIAGADCAPYSDLVPLTPVSSGDYASPVTNRLRSGSGYYTYDAAGNITVDKNQWTYAYDAENRLKSYSCGSNCGARRADAGYAYDGEGRRVRTVSGSTTTLFFYDASGRLAAEYLNGTLAKEYIYLGDRLLAFDPAGGTTTYLTQDHLGSTRLLTGAGPTVISRHDYLPFGDEVDGSRYRAGISGYTVPASPGPSRQKFTGKERDPESGLDFFGARYYSGPHGRFTSVDPKLTGVPFPEHLVQPQSWNMYAYALNNPLKFVDPDGEDVEVVVNFQGNLTDEEKKKILESVKTYLSKLDVGSVVVRQSTDKDKRTWGQFFTDLKPGNTGYFKIDATLEGGISKPGEAKFGDLLALREKDAGAFIAKAADTILHEVIAHQLKVGDQFDALTFQEWSPASPMYKKQQSSPYFLTRQRTLIDHTQRRAGDIHTPRPLYKDDQTKTEQRLKPIFRKYEKD